MFLDYNSKEKKELNAIEVLYKPLLDNAFLKLNDVQNDSSEQEQYQAEYSRLLAEYEEKREVITSKAEEREVRYFTNHIHELVKRLEIEIQAQIASFGILKEHDDIRTIYQNDDEMRNHVMATCNKYLQILEKNDTESYQRILGFIESSIADKESITQTYRTQLENPKAMSRKETSDSLPKSEKAVARRASDFFAPVDKVTKSVFDKRKNPAFYEEPEVLIRVGTKGGTTVKSIVSINIDELKSVTLSNDVMMNPYNRSIHNIAVSLYTAGNTHITPRMIYQALTGNRRGDRVPEQVQKDIMESMRKLMRTIIKIDATEEAKAFGLDKLKFEGYLLPVKLVTAQINGQEVECFKFLDEPPLYTYASKKRQINRCDIGLLAADVNITQENIVIRDYLLEQILTMQNERSKRNNVILYKTLYEYIGVNAPTEATLRAKKRDIRSKVKAILDAWVKANLITGYREVIEGRKICGLYIEYDKQRK